MVKMVGTFNGRILYSDKKTSSTTNYRVNFVDGSWIDMVNGDRMIRGLNDISVIPAFTDADISGTQRMIHGPVVFPNANSLFIRDAGIALILVEVWEKYAISVQLDGQELAVDNLKIDRIKDSIFIKGPAYAGLSANNVFPAEPTVTLTIKVPKRAYIDIRSPQVDLHIGEVEGELTVFSIDARIWADKVTKTKIVVQNQAEVILANVNGDFRIGMFGTGRFLVQNGQINSLEVDLGGNVNAWISTPVQTATLNMRDASSIYISEVIELPVQVRGGTGTFRIGNM